MLPTRLVYWISTTLFCTIFAISGTLYLLHSPFFAHRLDELGYPAYVLNIIGTAKLFGVIALFTPAMRRLKEWAYAGFAIDFIGAIWSHVAVQGVASALPLLIPVAILVISYVTYHRLQSRVTPVTVPQSIPRIAS